MSLGWNITVWIEILASLWLVLGASKLQAQGPCDPKAWAQFLAKVQSLASDSDAAGSPFLRCGSQDARDSAVFWLSFYYEKTAQKDRLPGLVKDRASLATGAKAQAIYRAWQGDPLSLKTRIQAGEEGFGNDRELLLVLARSSMRARLFKDAMEAYQSYLRQSESQDAIEVERVFAYIWAEDETGARNQIATVRRYEMSAGLKQSLERAEELLAQGKAKAAEAQDEEPIWVQFAGRRATDNRGYQAQTLLMLYEGWMDVELEASQERSDLEAGAHRLAYFQFGKEWKLGKKSSLEAALGYLSVGDQNLTARLGTDFHVGEHGELGFKLSREPLAALNIPLVEPRIGTLRDSLGYHFAYGRKVEWKAAVHRDGPDSFWYEDYSLLLRFGPRVEDRWAPGFNLIVPFAYRAHPQPSQDYLSYPKQVSSGVGLELTVTDGTSYRWLTAATLEALQRSSFYQPTSFQRVLAGTLKTEMRGYIRSGFFLFGRGEFNITEKSRGEASDLHKSLVLLGVAYQDHGRGGVP